jgi:HSP20 family protein
MADFRSLMPWGRGQMMQRGVFDPLSGFRQEMDRLLEDFGRSWPAGGTREGGATTGNFLIPKVDVCETEHGLELTAELPGFDEQDVSIDVQDNVLTIRAEHKEEREEKDDKRQYHLIERTQGSFLRRFALPFEADADHADAQLEKGLLKVMVPRLVTPERQAKKIPLGSAGKGTQH